MSEDTSADFTVWENHWIPLSDGRRLAARIWMPHDAVRAGSPAILEYLPYRKRDGTAPRDESTYPTFAAAGYVGIRVDIAGTGESDGCFDDEYSPQELADGVEVIEWIASQSWCSGAIGMMGISWGGFNSLQIASMQPAPLRAVVAIGTTVDRYNDDIHYKNGCLLYSNVWWSNVMLCYASRAPDPELVGEGWRNTWLSRLRTQPLPIETWLAHQRRDAYWAHGSVCEAYSRMTVPALVISGWADGYINAPPCAAANFHGPTKAINGPWIHKYPHFAYPKPRMDFHAEALRWFDRWLRDRPNGAEALPSYRAYVSEAVRPGGWRAEESGRWVAEDQWPPASQLEAVYFPQDNHLLGTVSTATGVVQVHSPLDCGTQAGEFFPLKPNAELSGDQRRDDAGSVCFSSEPLTEPVEILGRARFTARVRVNQPFGNLIVRLLDVHPDGLSHRVAWGVLNLCHRESNSAPSAVVPGEWMDVSLNLDECGYRFGPGQRIRVAVSTNYWPMILPPPGDVSLELALGPSTNVVLPIRAGGDAYSMSTPGVTDPLPVYQSHRPSASERTVETDLNQGVTRVRVLDDTGEDEMPGHGLRTRHVHQDCWEIAHDDPLSAKSSTQFISWMSRGAWSVRTESESHFHCDAENFYVRATVRAYEGDALVSEREWAHKVARDHM